MTHDLLYDTSLWIIYPLIVVLVMAAGEAGVLMTRLYRGREDVGKELFGTLSASTFGLLALMLGFTFAMAMTRYEERREAVLRDANTIGTAVLRALLAQESLVRSQALQNQIWQLAVTATTTDPRSLPLGLYEQALNDMIDQHEIRITALRNHVPDMVIVMLVLLAMVAIAFAGHDVALGRSGRRFAVTCMAVLIGLVITLILDLDRPQRGVIVDSQEPLHDLIGGLPAEAR
jgi:hypothetical protein